MQREIENGNVWFGPDGDGAPRLKRFLSSATMGLTPDTLWSANSVGTTDQAKKHILDIFPGVKVFDTPKPEPLLERIMDIATVPGDYVLDPYLGSGTTAAVACRLGRKYIGIERGPHAATLCAERMKKLILGYGFQTKEPELADSVTGFGYFRAPRALQ